MSSSSKPKAICRASTAICLALFFFLKYYLVFAIVGILLQNRLSLPQFFNSSRKQHNALTFVATEVQCVHFFL